MRVVLAVCLSLGLLSGCRAATPAKSAPPVLPIGSVQGPGAQSPMLGQRVAVEGVAVYAGDPALPPAGLYLQSAAVDADPRTSDAIYVELPAGAPRYGRDQLLRITGTVIELGKGEDSMTALADAQIRVVGTGRLRQERFSTRELDEQGLERYEAAFLSYALTVTGADRLQDRGELYVSLEGRLFAPTELAAPGAAARALAVRNRRRQLLLDDAIDPAAPANAWYLPQRMSAGYPLRYGTPLNLHGVIDQRSGRYRLLPDAVAEVDAIHSTLAARPEPPQVAGNLRIASLNVLNLFNGDGMGSGFPTQRGAETFAQYQRQQQKLVASVQALAPDIAALMEIENDGYGPESALAQFVQALNAAGPIRDYRFVDAGKGPGVNPIRVAMIYRETKVRPQGQPAVLEGGPFAERSRVPLAQAFRAGRGPAFVVVANHFKSKGCGRDADAATGLDADQHDEQSCWNALRVESAQRLMQWLKTDPTGSRSELQVLVGDFNAYAQEDPIRAFRDAGWVDALEQAREETKRQQAERNAQQPNAALVEIEIEDEPLYSFVYNGLSGRLDHALISPALAACLRGAAEWHNNADEAEVFDYRNEASTGPYRASDHDPLLLGFDLAK